MNITSNEAKWISMLVVGIGSFLIGIIPACFFARGRVVSKKLLLSCLLCFGAGVLLSTSVLHMLPETKELLPEYAELVFCCGFLLLYLIDEIAHYFWVKEETATTHSHMISTDRPAQNRIETNNRFSSTCVHHGLPNRSSLYQNEQPYCKEIYDVDPNAGCSSARDGSNASTILSHEPSCGILTSTRGNARFDDKSIRTHYGTLTPLVPHTSCSPNEVTLLCHGNHTEPCVNTNAGHIGLSLALTLHAILEGLAIGLQNESSEVFLLGGAVVSHKFVVAFCLGLELAGSASTFLKNMLAITLFSGGSALGIGIGMLAVQVETSQATIALPILQGLAGGTLLYVTVSEVLPRERARWHRDTRRSAGILQYSAVLLGFTLLYLINRYLDFDHVVSPR